MVQQFYSILNGSFKREFFPAFLYVLKWFLISLPVGAVVGAASAFFLYSLHWVTDYREANLWIIALLPLSGLLIGLGYHYFGAPIAGGNNQIIDEYLNPQQRIPFRMMPMVLIGTLLTHLFGGSAGREGTAVQMGASLADRFSYFFDVKSLDRRTLLVMGVSAGFSSVFGTPLAGAVFALEVMLVGRMRYETLVPSFFAAVAANYFCMLFPIHHTHYSIPEVPDITLITLFWAFVAAIFFGLTARSFSILKIFWKNIFTRTISYAPFRPLLGGALLALIFWAIGTSRYAGLGVPVIEEAFLTQVPLYDFAAKVLFTSFTLGAGFKGGEVTPLFFMGATLGNTLSLAIPLPMALLAGMGFVGVFSGATNTPIACTLMGIELFGAESGVFIGMACVGAYLFSGHTSVYTSQFVGSPKTQELKSEKGKSIGDLNKKNNSEAS
ncbi:MAG: voltage-gated chloride channel family protein [Bernardetiaceae bacterium]|nr:voltage-gated chloride channel family protein [Bernardetiaceae bacterium]